MSATRDPFDIAPDAFDAWAAGIPAGRGAWTPEQALAFAQMAFRAGWRRGWCAGRGNHYPPELDRTPTSTSPDAQENVNDNA